MRTWLQIAKDPNATWAELVSYSLHAPKYEPTERLHDGLRQHGHRFPIRGGVPAISVMAKNIAANNALLRSLMSK